MSYRDELIQVAAVAMAMVEDHDYGLADRTVLAQVMLDVTNERLRQDQKWGPQHHHPAVWLAILMEEVGEAAQAALKEIIDPAAEVAASE